MKVFFDTNVYVAESLYGRNAIEIIDATIDAGWKMFSSDHVTEELRSVLLDQIHLAAPFVGQTVSRVQKRTRLVSPPASRHRVKKDPKDSPILQAAIAASVDFLVTNDRHLLELDPYEGVRVINMAQYRTMLEDHGLLKPHPD